jgi:hypothetical protein
MVAVGHHAVQGTLDGDAAALDLRGGQGGESSGGALAVGDGLSARPEA